MNEESKSQAQITVNLVDVFSNIWNRKIISILIILVFTVIGFVYGSYFVKPKYVSEAKLIALEASDTGKVSTNEVALGSYLVNDYNEMVVDRTVLTQVIRELNLNMTTDQLRGRISITNPDDSRILEVSVSTSDPKLSQNINSKLCAVAKAKIAQALGADKVTIFSDASTPNGNSATKPSTFVILGFVCGVAVLILLSVVFTTFDDKIKNADDIEQYLGLCTLATIPYNSSKQKKKSSSRKAAKR